ncbi:hypothetical protein [Mucisphaera sp.]|uniref:hypothetical protein n=1 Tax=Mucisphaera sp. TaxID=2913024 RepID=UPI003D0C7592
MSDEATTTKTYAVAGGLLVLAVLTVCAGIYVYRAMQPLPMPETAEDVIAVLSDTRFKDLPDDRRAAYTQRMWEITQSLDRDQRRGLFEAMRENDVARDNSRMAREQMMVGMARQFAMADEAEREQILAGVEAMFEGMRRPRGEGPSRGDRPEGGGDRSSRQEERRNRFNERAATGNPQDSAMIREFFVALRERREAQRD